MAQASLDALLPLAAPPGGALSASPRGFAQLSLFDWLVVGRAGADAPLARILRGFVLEEPVVRSPR